MSERPCLLTVHAHPDDESSKGAGTVARYHDQGFRTVLVCCTGGEEGDILNPAMERPEVRENLAQFRRQELTEAAAIIGYDEIVWLGYRDSGMPGTPSNDDPRAFAQAPLEEAVGRLVEVIRRERPPVVITYPEEQSQYPHPDHLRVHEISAAAFEAAGDPARFPEAGPPYQPLKLYYTVWSKARMRALHEKFVELGMESPFDDQWLERLQPPDDPISTSIDITGFDHVRRNALLAHATQVDPASRIWFGLTGEVQATIHPYDDYLLAVSRVGPTEVTEDDLFAGVDLGPSLAPSRSAGPGRGGDA